MAYEVEFKCLLGEKSKADELLAKLQKDPTFESLGSGKQLNHYFTGGSLKLLYNYLKSHIDQTLVKQFEKLSAMISDFSVRTRQTDTHTILVIKLAQDETSSPNGIARMEFETKVDLTIDQLDELLLKSNFQYLSKWSRERQEFKYQGINVTIDKNAGYGYVAEFEQMVDVDGSLEMAKYNIKEKMNQLGVEELPQDRLARMFDYYNAHWQEYYGTDKVFNIE